MNNNIDRDRELTLLDAIRKLVEIIESDGGKLLPHINSSYLRRPYWPNPNGYQKSPLAKSQAEIFQQVNTAYTSALERLIGALRGGEIKSRGCFEGARAREYIAAVEWRSRRVDVWNSRLIDPADGSRANWPWITDIRVNLAELEAHFKGSRPPQRAASKYEMENKYRKYVEAIEARGGRSSIDDDMRAMGLPRKRTYELRNKLAPAQWKAPGRRRTT